MKNFERKSRLSEVDKTLNMLIKSSVLVGIPAAAGRSDGGPNNAALGYIHETGAPEQNIPARPFLKPGIASVRGEIAQYLAQGGAKALAAAGVEGGTVAKAQVEVDKALHRIGLVAQNAARGQIQAGLAPPLSERTVYARLHRKRGRRSAGPMTPLIDTGQLIRSITYTVRVKR